MLLLLALACTRGAIHTPEGTDRIRGALFVSGLDAGLPEVAKEVYILSNSELDCDLYEGAQVSDDPDGNPEVFTALTREGAKLVFLYLFRARSNPVEGAYTVAESASASEVGEDGVAGATWYEVLEAELDDQDGISRRYQPSEYRYVADVGGPGHVVLTHQGDHSRSGTFNLDAIDVSGRFRAERCQEEVLEKMFDVIVEFGPKDTGETLEVPPL